MNPDFAFPFPEVRWPDGTGVMDGSCGMTKREYYASQALIALINGYAIAYGSPTSAPKEIAREAVNLADHLISALSTRTASEE